LDLLVDEVVPVLTHHIRRLVGRSRVFPVAQKQDVALAILAILAAPLWVGTPRTPEVRIKREPIETPLKRR